MDKASRQKKKKDSCISTSAGACAHTTTFQIDGRSKGSCNMRFSFLPKNRAPNRLKGVKPEATSEWRPLLVCPWPADPGPAPWRPVAERAKDVDAPARRQFRMRPKKGKCSGEEAFGQPSEAGSHSLKAFVPLYSLPPSFTRHRYFLNFHVQTVFLSPRADTGRPPGSTPGGFHAPGICRK